MQVRRLPTGKTLSPPLYAPVRSHAIREIPFFLWETAALALLVIRAAV